MNFKRSVSYIDSDVGPDLRLQLDALEACAHCAALLKKCSPTFAALLIEELKEALKE
jgi:hypothetical protein